MSAYLVKFYRDYNGSLTLVRTDYCDNFIEADTLAENEQSNYDTISIIDTNPEREE